MASALAAAAVLVAITNVSVIDVRTGAVSAGSTVVIDGARIRSTTGSAPAGALRVDGRGKFPIPGLWDMHVHLGGIEADWFPLYLANGIVGLREMASTKERLRKVKLHTGPPRIFSTAESLDGPAIATTQQARAAVAELQAMGADFVKVYNGLSRDAYFAIADESKKRGMTFAGHVPDAVGAAEAARAGQKSIEHLDGVLLACSNVEAFIRKNWLAGQGPRPDFLMQTYDEPTAQALFATFRRYGLWQCPTLLQARFESSVNDPSMTADPRLRYVRKDYLDDWRRQLAKLRDVPLEKRMFDKKCALAGAMLKAGVKFLAGTDAPAEYSIPGFGLHDELQLMVERAGFPPLAALQSATIHPNEFFSLNGGVIEKGRPAELVLLDANPLVDINNTRRIGGVFTCGRYFDKAALNKMLDGVAAAAERPNRSVQ
jgi:imidazolonepropionase-like amidohydrolase